jgi:hypothetical protein
MYPLMLFAILFFILSFGKKKPIMMAFLAGIFVGLTFLAKYLAVALIPSFVIVWMLPFGVNIRGDFFGSVAIFYFRRALKVLVFLAPILLTITVWSLNADGYVGDISGQYYLANNIFDPNYLVNFGAWLIIIFAYMVLMCAPFVGIIAVGLASGNSKSVRKETDTAFASIVFMTALAFCLLATRHSATASYQEYHMSGRYIMYVGVPILLYAICRGAFLIKTVPEMKRLSVSSILKYVSAFIFSTGVVSLSYAILIQKHIIHTRPLAFLMPHVSPEVYAYDVVGYAALALAIFLVVIPFFIIIFKKYAQKIFILYCLITAFFLLYFSISTSTAVGYMQGDGIVGRALVKTIVETYPGRTDIVVYDDLGYNLKYSIPFWMGENGKRIKVIEIDKSYIGVLGGEEDGVFLTDRVFGGELKRAEFKERNTTYYIYRLPINTKKSK